jgi:site-specific recombinase XerD
MTVLQLTEAVLPYIRAKNYSESYVKSFGCVFNRLNRYCADRGIAYFTTEVGQQFLQQRYGLQPGTVDRSLSRPIRAMDMLADFQQFGAVMIRRRLDRKFPEQFSCHAEGYLARMEKDHAQPNTVLSHRKALYRLTDFLDSRGVRSYAEIALEHINSYIEVTLCNYSKDSARCFFGIARKFLRYLYENGIVTEDFSEKVVSVPGTRQPARLPATLTSDQIEAVLACVDRESPMGKRDYAILLLAARLGLRVSDIRNLRPGDIDWEKHELRITQAKTGQALVLPLPTDVGWAMIDYMKNARPASDVPEIFLRVVAPYVPLYNPDNILIRYMRLAKIPYERLSHHGLHTLRHSLATHMLEEDIPITTIQGVLGHLSIETTERYTGVDVGQLKKCALEVPDL